MSLSTVKQVSDIRVTSSQLVKSCYTNFYGILVATDGDAAKVDLYDSLTATGTPAMTFTAVENGSQFIDLSGIGPRAFLTGLYVGLTGEDTIVHIWYA